MDRYRNERLSNYKRVSTSHYSRYVEDILSGFMTHEEAKQILTYLNSRLCNVKLTNKTEDNDAIPFLDVLVDNCNNYFENTTYYRSTYFGLVLTCNSFTSRFCKINIIKCLKNCN